MQDGAYSGLRVLELGQGVAAPYCGMLLAQHGADVIKIEPVGDGDWCRALGRRYGQFTANAIVVNRGKRSLALDLKSADGQAVIQQLAEKADVIIENYRPGVVERLKLDYDSVAARNPKVVYLSLTGFGTVGPNKNLAATDTVMQGYSGIMSINRDTDGMPRRLDMLAIDMATGLYLFQAVSAAIYKRLAKGVGSRIATNLLHAGLAFQEAKLVEFALSGINNEATGAPVGTWKTSDGFVSMNARRDPHFSSLCKLLGKDWMSDERFRTPEARVANAAALDSYLKPIFAEKTTKQWCELLASVDILNAPVKEYSDLFVDPQVEAIGALNWHDVANVGRFPLVALPGLNGPQPDARAKAPGVGEHTSAVLSELGYSSADIERMRQARAIS